MDKQTNQRMLSHPGEQSGVPHQERHKGTPCQPCLAQPHHGKGGLMPAASGAAPQQSVTGQQAHLPLLSMDTLSSSWAVCIILEPAVVGPGQYPR